MRAARPSVAISSSAAVGGGGGVEGGDAAALEEAAREADAAAVRHEERGAAVQRAVAQAGQHAALLRLPGSRRRGSGTSPGGRGSAATRPAPRA